MVAIKDFTKKQFLAALKRNGMVPSGGPFVGFVNVTPVPGTMQGTNVYAPNAGPNLRNQLAYLIREQEKSREWYAARERQKEARRTLMLPPYGTAQPE